MRDLSPDEINELLDKCDWGTLLLVDGDKPYGIEVSHYQEQPKCRLQSLQRRLITTDVVCCYC